MSKTFTGWLIRGALLAGLACSCGGGVEACAGPGGKHLPQREAALKSSLNTFRKAIDLYKADKGYYPESLEALVEEHYLRSIPPDPITKRADTWILIYEELDPEAALSEGAPRGVYDVRSGALGSSLNGSPYSKF